MEPVTNSEGKKGFYDASTGFIGVDDMQKVTNDKGQKGYYHAKAGFVPAPQTDIVAPAPPKQPAQTGTWIGQTVDKLKDDINDPRFSGLTLAPRMASTAIGQVGKGFTSMLPSPSDATKEFWVTQYQDFTKTPVGKMAVSLFQRGGDAWDSFAQANPGVAAGVIKGAEAGINLGLLAVPVKATPKLGEKLPMVEGRLTTKPTADEALGQVLQGQTKDLAQGRTALGVTSTEGVKTYGELKNRISNAVREYVTKVDTELAKDQNKYTMDWLSTTSTTKQGTKVTQNYVETALTHLKELYEKTAEPVKAADIDETIMRAKSEGLSRVEVNNIARQYNKEFGNEMFSKTNAPLTSVNAQMAQNVRQGVKNVAREGMSGEAKEADAVLGSLLNTQDLIKKNVEAVNKLRQKVDERGLGEKAGRKILDIIDVATLGTLKGAVQRLAPRGLGYKTKNWIDLEESLQRNLKIVNKANDAWQ